MSNQRANAIGTCGACKRLIHEMTPIGNVERGGRRHMAHKTCADKENAPVAQETVVVSTPGIDISPESIISVEDFVTQPSMPVKEQVGRRRKKAADDS